MPYEDHDGHSMQYVEGDTVRATCYDCDHTMMVPAGTIKIQPTVTFPCPKCGGTNWQVDIEQYDDEEA